MSWHLSNFRVIFSPVPVTIVALSVQGRDYSGALQSDQCESKADPALLIA